MKDGYCPRCEEYTMQRFYGDLQVIKMKPGKEYHQPDASRSPFFTSVDEIWWCPNCGEAHFYAGMLREEVLEVHLDESEENLKQWKKEKYTAPAEEYFG